MGNDHADHHILSGVRCPTCKGRYSLMKFLGKNGNLYKVLVHCPVCNTYGIGTARIGETTSLTAPVSPSPASAIPAGPVPVNTPLKPAITADDVLDMHEFLANFDGDFKALFAGTSFL